MALFSHRHGFRETSQFSEIENMTKDFKIDIYDYLCNIYNVYSEDYNPYPLIHEALDIAISVHRNILGKTRTSFYNGINKARDEVHDAIYNTHPACVFDIIEIICKNFPAFITELKDIVDKYCLSWRIDPNSGEMIPRLSEAENEIIDESNSITSAKYPAVNKYMTEAMGLIKAGEDHAAIGKSYDAMEALGKSLSNSEKPFGTYLNSIRAQLSPEIISLVIDPLQKFWGTGRNGLAGHGDTQHHERGYSRAEALFVYVTVSSAITYLHEKFEHKETAAAA